MQFLYDPLSSEYMDPADARAERDRTFHQCADCRLCIKYCYSFKTLFKAIDDGEYAEHIHDLPSAVHEQVVDECFQCKLCYINCPYTPDKDQDWKIDFPGLMLRSLAIQARDGRVEKGARLLARTDLQGKVATTFAPIVNSSNKVRPVRNLLEKVTGISKDRMLPVFTKERFSKWFGKRTRSRVTGASHERGTVALFPTCLVEYQNPAIGQALVGVYERNGIACDLPDGEVCCGMPWLDAGDTDKFREHAKKNIAALLPHVRAGKDVVVPQPTCAFTLRSEYPSFLGTPEAREVAERTFDAAEYLVKQHGVAPLDTNYDGTTYSSILWQQACHYQAQHVGPKSAEMMRLTGAKVEILNRCSAIDGTWGLRKENVAMAKKIATPLMEKVAKSEADLIVGDCNLSNTAINEATGKQPLHPLQVMARAYGIEEGA
ncbi:MAG: heterodisulfide reductase-related iron-sulfur binding cluster [Acidimicrobiia bacterium]